MNDEQKELDSEVKPSEPTKRKMLSMPFLLLGVLLLAGLCPVGDIDGDGGTDVAGKWIMLKVMTNQEKSKVGPPAMPDDIPEKPENPPVAGA